MINSEQEVVGAASGTQGGEDQTQVAACLAAILFVVRQSYGDVLLKPDCNVAIDAVNEVIRGQNKQFGAHAHILHELASALEQRRGGVRLLRVDAHANLQDYIAMGMDVNDWVGNELADYLAGEAAASNAASEEMTSNWLTLGARANNILRRAVAVHRLFMEAEQAAGGRELGQWIRREHPVHAAIKQSGHQLVRDQRGAFQCLACGQRASQRQLKSWLSNGKCHARRVVGQDGLCTQPEGESVVIGRCTTHPSHSLAWRRGVWFCTSCGAYAKACIDHKSTCHLLGSQCHGAPSGSGAKVLRRLEAGDTPRHGMAWPLPEFNEARLAAAPVEELWPDKRGAPRRSKRKRVEPSGGDRKCMRSDSQSVGIDSEETDFNMHANLDEPISEYALIEDEDPWGDQERWELD